MSASVSDACCNTRRSAPAACSVLGWVVLLLASPAFAQPAPATAASGPTSLVISYRCKPADRPAFREYLQGPGAARFEALKKAGTVADYQFVFSWYHEPLTWDAMAIVRFDRYADVARWNALERKSPGGLDARGLALCQPDVTVSADLRWQEGDAAPAGSGRIHYVIPYEYRERAEYQRYVDGYVIPQVKGWMRAGILSRYRIFLNRYPVGPTWDALFVYEYKDIEAFGRRESIIAEVRGPLREDPEWAALHAIKHEIRSESPNVIADDLSGR